MNPIQALIDEANGIIQSCQTQDPNIEVINEQLTEEKMTTPNPFMPVKDDEPTFEVKIGEPEAPGFKIPPKPVTVTITADTEPEKPKRRNRTLPTQTIPNVETTEEVINPPVASDFSVKREAYLTEIKANKIAPVWVGEGEIKTLGFSVWTNGYPKYFYHEVPKDEFNSLAYTKTLNSFKEIDSRVCTDTASIQSIVPKALADNLYGGLETPCSMKVTNSDGSVKIGAYKMGERVEIGVVRTDKGFFTVMRKKGNK